MASPARILPIQPAARTWQTLHDLAEPRPARPTWLSLANLDSGPESHHSAAEMPVWSTVEMLMSPADPATARVIPIAYLRKNSVFSTFSDILLDDFA